MGDERKGIMNMKVGKTRSSLNSLFQSSFLPFFHSSKFLPSFKKKKFLPSSSESFLPSFDENTGTSTGKDRDIDSEPIILLVLTGRLVVVLRLSLPASGCQ